jgi:hypothetical protein
MMVTATWMYAAAGVLALVTCFFLGWWLGRRRQSVQVKSLRRELQDAYNDAQRALVTLQRRCDAIVQSAMQTAVNAVRAQWRKP